MKVYFYILFIAVVAASCESTKEENTVKGKVSNLETSQGNEADVEVTDAYEANALPDGNFLDYYPNEQLKVSGMVSSGVRIGKWVSYHLNGNKQSENEYENGILHGKTVTYYENGQIMYIGYFKGGNYEGDWLYYSKEGVHLKTVMYKSGTVIESKTVNDTIL